MDPVSVILKARNAHLAGIAPTAADKQHADALIIPLVAGFQTGVQAPVVFGQVQMFACRNPRAHLGRSMPNAAMVISIRAPSSVLKAQFLSRWALVSAEMVCQSAPGFRIQPFACQVTVPPKIGILLSPSATRAISRIETRSTARSQKRVNWGH